MNTITGLFETLVGVATESAAGAVPKFKNSMLGKVFMGWRPVYNGAIGSTININIPTVDESNVTDIGSDDIQIKDTNHSTVTVTVNRKPSNPIIIRSFDQLRTPQDLKTLYTDKMVEECLRYVNRVICQLVTSTNFNSYTTVTGGDDVFTRTHVATAWNNLAGEGVPLDDQGNLFFVTSNTPYSKMLTDSTWSQESIVGVKRAEASQSARLMTTFGAELDWDQQFPQPTAGSVFAALLFHRYAIALRAVQEPGMEGSHIKETWIYPRPNLPLKVQMWEDPNKQGIVIHITCAFGLAVVRPAYGSYLQST